ncbi:helix-turn-helix transcriptional regulator [Actinomadura sp. 9N215]|uniref:helix-turn-helix transcriptional regulator n=1 Tax=Actinomadura sp. 9N215 TaxID=3375150 RepID=UPI00379F48D8
MSEKATQQIEDAGVAQHVARGDRLVQFAEAAEITTLSPATLRWMRHQGEGPPFFTLGRRLVISESRLYDWINAQAAKDRAAAS